jgi:SAM-dependent methyltransferase
MIGHFESGVGKAAKVTTPSFDRLVRVYRWMEYLTFGTYLASCRFAFLPALTKCRRALVIGDGDGRFTARLLRVNRELEVEAVDASRSMLEALVRRAGMDAARVRACRADVRDWQPAENPYDLVVTHFFLDCLTTDEICHLAERVRGSVARSARWVVSEFAIPRGWYGRIIARPLVWLLYGAFGVLTGLEVRRLPDHARALESAGFRLDQRRCRLKGLLASEIWRCGPGPAGEAAEPLRINGFAGESPAATTCNAPDASR